MAELETRLPLLVKGFNIDPANAFAAAQDVRGKMLANEATAIDNSTLGRRNELALSRAEMGNELASMELGDARARLGAMQEFRDARRAGDPNATDELAAYPDIQLQMEQTLDGLEERDRIDAVQRGRRVADAARMVSSIPEGPARVDAWNAALDDLLESGDISPEVAESYRDTPSPLILSEALRMGETLEQYIQRQDAAAARALEQSQERPTRYEQLTFSQKLEIDKQATDKVRAITGNAIVPPDAEKAQELFEQARNEVLAAAGIEPPSTSVKPGGKKGKKKKGNDDATSALPPPPVQEPASTGQVDWTTLTPEAQEEATRMLTEAPDRAAAIAEFNATFGEGAAEAVIGSR